MLINTWRLIVKNIYLNSEQGPTVTSTIWESYSLVNLKAAGLLSLKVKAHKLLTLLA